MSKQENVFKAKRTISNGRLLTIVTIIPLVGSILKLFILGSPVDANSVKIIENVQTGLTQTAIETDSFSSFLLFFPSINTNYIATPDNFVSAALFLGFLFGLSNWKKGLSALKIAEQ